VAEIVSGGVHVEEELLGLHFMDALQPAQSDEIHRHLEACAECRGKADDVIETVAALALLGVDESIPETGTVKPPAPAAAPEVAPSPAAPVAPVAKPAAEAGHVVKKAGATVTGASSTRPGPGRAGSSRPGSGGRSSAGPGRSSGRRGRLGKLLGASGLLVLALVVGGLGLSAYFRDSGPTTKIEQVSARGQATTGTASASIVATPQETGGVLVTATVTGLQQDKNYLLYGVTTNGEIALITRWSGQPQVQEVKGSLPYAMEQISSFTVSTEDEQTVVAVPVTR
jgi:hypothetical protein